MNFNSLSDLNKFIQSKQGTQTVFGSENVKLSLKEAADLLYKILHEQLEEYYASYQPKVYERTYNFLNSLRISPIEQRSNEITMSVYFDENMATHPSIFDGEPGFVPILLNEGWQWKSGESIYHLSHYEGFHFIEKSIDEFNLLNKWGFKIRKEGHHNGQKI